MTEGSFRDEAHVGGMPGCVGFWYRAPSSGSFCNVVLPAVA